MQRIIVTAAAMLLGAGLAATTAKADMHYGPTTDKGMCFKRAAGSAEMGYGYWAPCPAPAAATTTTTVHHRHAKHS
jgi:hypothetical protein